MKKMKACMSRVKRWASRLLDLIVNGSGPPPGVKPDDWWWYPGEW